MILKFPTIKRRADEVRPDDTGATAQILFFTGVRYERTEPKRKRKVVAVEPELPLAL